MNVKVIKFEVVLDGGSVRVAEFHTKEKVKELMESSDMGPFLRALADAKDPVAAAAGDSECLGVITTDER